METRYPSYRKLGGALGPVSCVRKISPPPGVEPETGQSVAKRYTDYTISGPWIRRMKEKGPAPSSSHHLPLACLCPSFFHHIYLFFPRALLSYPEDGGSTFLRNSSGTYTRLYGVTYCTIAVITVTAVTKLDVTACLSRMSAGNTDGLVKFQK
jgi:hypothetical protein